MNAQERSEKSPGEDQIEETIQIISRKLQHPTTNREENIGIKNGYREAIKILVEGIRSYDQIDVSLEAGQAMSIAIMAVDYLNGECSQQALVGVESR